MKTLFGLFLITLFLGCTFASAQSSAPFAELDEHIKTERNGYFGGDETTVALFNAERERLGKNFETELFKYLGKDAEKHKWIALYLKDEDYLQGNEPLLQLSLRILQRGLDLIETQKEDESRSATSLNVYAALLSLKLKMPAQARAHKAKVEELLKKGDDYLGTFPALSDKDRAIYDSIPY